MSLQPRGGRLRGDYYVMTWHRNTGISNATNYWAISSNISSTTEANVQLPSDFDLILRRVRLLVAANTMSANTVVSFRRNGATVTGTTFTITSGGTGPSTSGVLSIPISAGDLINGLVDASASAMSGDFDHVVYLYFQRVVE